MERNRIALLGTRSKPWVYGHSSTEIAGSNPAGGTNVSLL